jgi:hypothetical protein
MADLAAGFEDRLDVAQEIDFRRLGARGNYTQENEQRTATHECVAFELAIGRRKVQKAGSALR